VVTHEDETIAESGAIVEYLLDHFGEGRLRPALGTDDYERYRLFLHFAEGSMMPPLLVKLIIGRLKKAVPFLGKAIASKVDANYTDPEMASHLAFVEASLEGREWLAGELSGADVMMCFPVQASVTRSGLAGDFPNVRAYVARIEARPAWARAIERGGEHIIAS
jgi:glutathione S-transferase